MSCVRQLVVTVALACFAGCGAPPTEDGMSGSSLLTAHGEGLGVPMTLPGHCMVDSGKIDGSFFIANQGTARCLDAAGGGLALTDCSGAIPTQRWNLSGKQLCSAVTSTCLD